MNITRRQFLGSTAVVTAGGALTALTFSVPQCLVSSEKRLGFMAQAFAFSVFKEDIQRHHTVYTDFVGALNDLRTGKIDYLVSSSDYLAMYNPAFSLFGSLPLDPVASQKWKWVQTHYPALQKYYQGLGFQSQALGLMHPLALRLSRLSPADLNNWRESDRKIRVASTARRSAWFECLGFEVLNGKYHDRLSYQLELIDRGRLDLTESFSPWAFIPSIEHNIRNRGIAPEAHRGQTVFLDDTTRSAHLIELIQFPAKAGSEDKTREVAEHLRRVITDDDATQQKIFTEFVATQQLQVHQGLPEQLKLKMRKYKQHYLARIEEKYSAASALVHDYRKFEV